ncbi:MAG: STAS domain-containing protein [Actinomycetota bacterium]|nr:STAS domain-containing protein [Actinomycetota bacterium]
MALLEEPPDSDPLPESEVSISFEAGSALITLSGEIDLAMAGGLEFVAEEAIVRALPVRVDLSRVTFMDSAGVGFVAALVRAGYDAGWQPTVIGPSRRVLETLTLTGLVPFLEVQQTETPART